MKKLVIALALLFSVSFFSCTGESKQQDNTEAEGDTIQQKDSVVEVSGVAIDGAMNSVYLKVGDDTVEFTYPDLDSEHRSSWEIDDSLTVRYYVTENGDSVTDVINNTNA